MAIARGPVFAQTFPAAADQPRALDELAEMSLDDLLNTKITVATGSELNMAQSPSIVSIITADDLRRMGVSSIAEALRMVPGFYDVFDGVSHNVGIRGITGGFRASGSVLKLMIDGQSVADLGSTGNFFGPELIPIEAVERIEIIRGPGSALYGANAFLGVINVITKQGNEHPGATLRGQAGVTQGNPSYGGGAVIGVGGKEGEALIAVHGMRLDRSGMKLPASSPALHQSSPYRGDLVSRDDLAQPISLLVRGSTGEVDGHGRLSALAVLEHLDANAEFNDLRPMTHRTRVVRNIETYRVEYRIELLKNLKLQAYGTHQRSGPATNDLFDVGSPDFVLRSTQRSRAWEGGGRIEGRLLGRVDLMGGMDYRAEHHAAFTYDQEITHDILDSMGDVFRPAGARMPNSPGRDASFDFKNVGGYAQAYSRFLDLISVTVGVRFDDHNVYGLHWSPRAGIVLAPEGKPYFAKVLYGASFKPPSAEQLHAHPAAEGDVVGYEEAVYRAFSRPLAAQSASSWEVAAGTRLGRVGSVQVNCYATHVEGRVEYSYIGSGFLPRNELDEWVAGGETELQVEPMDRLTMWLGLSVAKSVARTPLEEGGVIGEDRLEQPLYPVFQAHGWTSYRVPALELTVSPELSLVSKRARPLSLPGVDDALPAYFLLNLALSRAWRWQAERTVHASIRATNLTGTRFAEPGYIGFDVPGLGTSVLGTVDFEL